MPDLHVNPQGIIEYSGKIAGHQFDAVDALGLLADMSPTAVDAFMSSPGSGMLPEAGIVMSTLSTNSQAYAAFLKDVGQGLMAIGSAAAVCADTYANTDAESAEQINLTQFAFGQSRTRPPGLDERLGKTFTDLDAEQTAKGISNQAADPTSPPVSTANFPGGTLYVYGDGSTRQKSVSIAADGTRTERVFVMNSNRDLTQDEITTTRGNTVTRETGTPGQAGYFKSEAVTAANGGVTITTTRTEKTADGKGVTTTSKTTTVAPPTTGSTAADTKPGPMEELVTADRAAAAKAGYVAW